MRIYKKVLTAGALALALSSAQAATVIDFENQANGSNTALTIGDVSFETFGGQTFNIENTYGGNYNTTGKYLANSYSGTAFGSLKMTFANTVSDLGFNFGASDVTWTLSGFNSQGGLIDSLLIGATQGSNAGDYFGITGAGISYATLTGDAGDYVMLDNLTFTTAVPEPSVYALMLGGLGLVGFMASRRRKQA